MSARHRGSPAGGQEPSVRRRSRSMKCFILAVLMGVMVSLTGCADMTGTQTATVTGMGGAEERPVGGGGGGAGGGALIGAIAGNAGLGAAIGGAAGLAGGYISGK